jgi:CTP:molybdopterin cytidylyltransferase MocA
MNVGVLLAAGDSRRMGRSKPLVRTNGASFLAQGVRHLWAACDSVIVVLGSGAAAIRSAAEAEFERLVQAGQLHDDIQTAHRHGARGLEACFVVNRSWRSGMYGSVRIGLRTALEKRPDSVLILPVDHPEVRPATVRALAEAMREALQAYGGKGAGARKPVKSRRAPGFAYALVPRYRKRRGHPIALSPALATAVAADADAENLSDAVRRNARLVGYLDGEDPGVVRNRNTPGD